jgi:ABC-type transporter Mla subunit MlaD
MLSDAAISDAAAVGGLVSPIVKSIRPEIEKLVALPQPIITGLKGLQAKLEAAPEDTGALAAALREDLDGLLDGLTERIETLLETLEDTVERMKAGTENMLGAVQGRVDTFIETIEEGICEVGKTLDEAVGSIEIVRESSLAATSEFVDGVNENFGKIVDGLKTIETKLEPVMPVLSMLKRLT